MIKMFPNYSNKYALESTNPYKAIPNRSNSQLNKCYKFQRADQTVLNYSKILIMKL